MSPDKPAASILFVSHGGGPRPLFDDPEHRELIQFLRQIPEEAPKPEAILVISAHWEEPVATLTSGDAPDLYYDYYNFPPEAYQVKYPAPGDPALATKISDLLAGQNFTAQLNAERGFDHGMFVPLKLMYPDASIPCVQLSLLKNLDPAQHLALGESLQPLLNENLLILGSGFTFHNLGEFFTPISAQKQQLNVDFENYLKDSLGDAQLSEAERRARLENWQAAPGARFCHPREEHLLPLMVCYGAAQSAARKIYSLEIVGKQSSCYLW